MTPKNCQILIVGAGITGLTIARELLKRGVKDILIIEKESGTGCHSSGRNSGVLHAGMYYTPETLKAKYCVRGNRLMKEFCRAKGLTLQETGKVILAGDSTEIESLYELKRRADLCGARAYLIGRKELHELEPGAAPGDQALFSPDTAVIKPTEVLAALEAELEASGKVKISFGTVFRGLDGGGRAVTSAGRVRFEKLVNAAGSYADRVAGQFGLAGEYKILPFKGTYKQLAPHRAHLVKGNIYPVPNLKTPFLGIHLTRSAEGEVLVGPTAMPALGRENYHFLDGWSPETLSILYRDALLMFQNSTFRQVAVSEPKKYLKYFVWKEARKLVPELSLSDIVESSHVGIRPQLIHWPTRKLVMDYIILKDTQSLHILNPISPAFTSSMAFAEDVVEQLLS